MFVPSMIFFMSLLIGSCYGDSPAFLWGNTCEKKPALYNVKQNEFIKIMKPMLQDSMIVTFLEPELNTIDFLSKTDNSESCYKNLKEFPDYTYFTSVNKPVEALQELTQLQEYAIVDKNGNLKPSIKYQIGKIVFIDLKNIDDNRSMLLKKHDTTINKIYKQLSSKGKVTGLYTSSQVSQRRIRRQTTNNKKSGSKFYGKEFLLYYSMLSFKENDKEPVKLNGGEMSVTKNNTSLNVKLTTDQNELTFDIIMNQGYYKMKNLKYGDEMFLISSAPEAPTGYSFICGSTVFTAVNPNLKNQMTSSKIIWNGLQMQAFTDKEQEQSKSVFGEPWDCSGYFSAGILGVLFVTFMLLFILAIAVAWLMDINTMDRFENNRSGKTITINATD